MSHAEPITTTTLLRVLPLPGRGDVEAPIQASVEAVKPKKQKPTSPDGVAAAAQRKQETDQVIVLASLPASLAQSLALTPYAPRANFNAPGQKLADQVVGYLLAAQEKSSVSARGSTGHDFYRNAAAGFPRKNDSLFSLVG